MVEPVTMTGAAEGEGQQLARLVDQTRVRGIDLVGPGGLLTGLTKQVLETSHLGAEILNS